MDEVVVFEEQRLEFRRQWPEFSTFHSSRWARGPDTVSRANPRQPKRPLL